MTIRDDARAKCIEVGETIPQGVDKGGIPNAYEARIDAYGRRIDYLQQQLREQEQTIAELEGVIYHRDCMFAELAGAIDTMAESPKGGKMAAIAYRHAARLIRCRINEFAGLHNDL